MVNGTMMQYFHWYFPNDGSLYTRLIKDIPYLKSIGINAVWLPPAYKDASQGLHCGYDAYDLFDLGEFDQKGRIRTKYGTKDEYIKALKTAADNNISVYADVVLNHKAGADETEKVHVVEVDANNRKEKIGDAFEAEIFTRFLFPGRKGTYSSFIWDKECFSGVDYCEQPQKKGIFKILNQWGDDWADTISDEHGNFDYLMFTDIEFRNPVVREELKYWIRWYYETTGFTGIRLDAVKHIDPGFFVEWLDYMRAFAGREFFAVGELWTGHDLEMLHKFIQATQGKMHLFDSILHSHFYQASKQGEAYDLRNIFKGSFVEANPLLAVTLVDNHDTQPLQAMEAFVEHWFRPHAYALILLRKDGYPCVFYPDVFGAEYSDMKNDEEKLISLQPVEKLPALLKLRDNLFVGEQHDFFDDANCIAWIRNGLLEKEHSGGIVVINNGPATHKTIEAGEAFKNAGLKPVFDDVPADIVTVTENGQVSLPVPEKGISVWIREHASFKA